MPVLREPVSWRRTEPQGARRRNELTESERANVRAALKFLRGRFRRLRSSCPRHGSRSTPHARPEAWLPRDLGLKHANGPPPNGRADDGGPERGKDGSIGAIPAKDALNFALVRRDEQSIGVDQASAPDAAAVQDEDVAQNRELQDAVEPLPRAPHRLFRSQFVSGKPSVFQRIPISRTATEYPFSDRRSAETLPPNPEPTMATS